MGVMASHFNTPPWEAGPRPCVGITGQPVGNMHPHDSIDYIDSDVDEAPSPARLRRSNSRPRVILVADDNALFRKLLCRLMRNEGHLVLAAADGQEGLELSRQYSGSIDLVITDMLMPRLNGAGLCARLSEERFGIKTLVITGAELTEIVSELAGLSFLPKPVDSDILRARVRELLAA